MRISLDRAFSSLHLHKGSARPLPSVKARASGLSFTCLQDHSGYKLTFTYRRQRGVCSRKQRGIHKSIVLGSLRRNLASLTPVGGGATGSPGLKEVSKVGNWRAGVCIRELRSGSAEGDLALLRKIWKKRVTFGYPEGTEAR